jgi:hypothetical protein
MIQDAKHVIRRLSRPCADCGGKKLVVSEYKREIDGVIFIDRYEECLICGAMEKIIDKRDNKRLEFE